MSPPQSNIDDMSDHAPTPSPLSAMAPGSPSPSILQQQTASGPNSGTTTPAPPNVPAMETAAAAATPLSGGGGGGSSNSSSSNGSSTNNNNNNNNNNNYAFLVHSQETIPWNLPPDVDNKPLARQKRRRTSPEDQAILEAEYAKNPKPDKAARTDISNRVALGEKEVQIWFQNRRQNVRRKAKPLSPQELPQPKTPSTHASPSVGGNASITPTDDYVTGLESSGLRGNSHQAASAALAAAVGICPQPTPPSSAERPAAALLPGRMARSVAPFASVTLPPHHLAPPALSPDAAQASFIGPRLQHSSSDLTTGAENTAADLQSMLSSAHQEPRQQSQNPQHHDSPNAGATDSRAMQTPDQSPDVGGIGTAQKQSLKRQSSSVRLRLSLEGKAHLVTDEDDPFVWPQPSPVRPSTVKPLQQPFVPLMAGNRTRRPPILPALDLLASTTTAAARARGGLGGRQLRASRNWDIFRDDRAIDTVARVNAAAHARRLRPSLTDSAAIAAAAASVSGSGSLSSPTRPLMHHNRPASSSQMLAAEPLAKPIGSRPAASSSSSSAFRASAARLPRDYRALPGYATTLARPLKEGFGSDDDLKKPSAPDLLDSGDSDKENWLPLVRSGDELIGQLPTARAPLPSSGGAAGASSLSSSSKRRRQRSVLHENGSATDGRKRRRIQQRRQQQPQQQQLLRQHSRSRRGDVDVGDEDMDDDDGEMDGLDELSSVGEQGKRKPAAAASTSSRLPKVERSVAGDVTETDTEGGEGEGDETQGEAGARAAGEGSRAGGVRERKRGAAGAASAAAAAVATVGGRMGGGQKRLRTNAGGMATTAAMPAARSPRRKLLRASNTAAAASAPNTPTAAAHMTSTAPRVAATAAATAAASATESNTEDDEDLNVVQTLLSLSQGSWA